MRSSTLLQGRFVTNSTTSQATFRQRLRDKAHLLGTFVKIPSPHATEILGGLGFDFVIIDAEHAPLDRVTIDTMALAARAIDIPALVRVREANASSILSALDCGATGVLVPHVFSPARAHEIVAACRYSGGARGFSNTTRAGGYGQLGIADHTSQQDAQVTCVAMIEDLAALDHLNEIASVPGIDAFFIGRGDLTVAMGLESPTDSKVNEVVARICTAANAANVPIMVLPSNKTDAVAMKTLGATAFVLLNDQSLLRRAAQDVLTEYSNI
jgi:staphyloferrin B biosynthesis citrate synthase